jgi:hypothetical protein
MIWNAIGGSWAVVTAAVATWILNVVTVASRAMSAANVFLTTVVGRLQVVTLLLTLCTFFLFLGLASWGLRMGFEQLDRIGAGSGILYGNWIADNLSALNVVLPLTEGYYYLSAVLMCWAGVSLWSLLKKYYLEVRR